MNREQALRVRQYPELRFVESGRGFAHECEAIPRGRPPAGHHSGSGAAVSRQAVGPNHRISLRARRMTLSDRRFQTNIYAASGQLISASDLRRTNLPTKIS